MSRADVLVVGAGPTGLVLALWLTRLGVRVRIVDKAPEPGPTSRAIGVQARTLELYRQLDLDREVVAAGCPTRGINLWVEGERRGRLELGEMGNGLSPFPYVLAYPQDEHEKLLIAHLEQLGVRIDRPTEVVDLAGGNDRIAVSFRRAGGTLETCDVAWVAGCDGARSFVREALEVGFPGGTYSHLFYVADVEASGPTANGEAHVALENESNFLVCFGLGGRQVRLIGTLREDATRSREALGWNDVARDVIQHLHLDVERVNWFSTYRVHHRVATAFRVDRIFLLGDAAHIHSPVGGQGMNTGIGDAINLAWKLAAVLHGHADARLLESYEEERFPFALRLVHSTDRVFELVASDGHMARRLRVGMVPRVLTALFHSDSVRRFLFRTVSQINVNYRGSSLSEGRAGRVFGGDRLPWIPPNGHGDNFEPLTSLDWQVHVYGIPTSALEAQCVALHLPLHAFAWDARARRSGFTRDAAYLVRPDGYVGLAASRNGAAGKLQAYFRDRNLEPASA